MEIIKDEHGKIPAFIVYRGRLIHQPSGELIKLDDDSDATLLRAHKQLSETVGAT
jgi:hypothetical protein